MVTNKNSSNIFFINFFLFSCQKIFDERLELHLSSNIDQAIDFSSSFVISLFYYRTRLDVFCSMYGKQHKKGWKKEWKGNENDKKTFKLKS